VFARRDLHDAHAADKRREEEMPRMSAALKYVVHA
jgi:hypothetical protein